MFKLFLLIFIIVVPIFLLQSKIHIDFKSFFKKGFKKKDNPFRFDLLLW